MENLFKELDNFLTNGQYSEAVSSCDKILKSAPTDKEAFQCKVVALLHLGKSAEALKLLNSNSLGDDLLFEKAYALYRERDYQKSLDVVKKIPEPKPPRVLKLESQIYYRLEDYRNGVKVFEKIIQQSETKSSELQTNLFALYVFGDLNKEVQQFLSSRKEIQGFELAYNIACFYVERGEYPSAIEYLQLALKMCKESFSNEPQTFEDESAVIKTQLAFVYQLQGKKDQSLELYNFVLKQKPSDETVSAVASNNIVVMHQNHDLFDSAKKLKHISNQTLEQKLSSSQRKTISFNQALVSLHMSKFDECRKLAQALQQSFPDSDRLAIIEASLLLKEKKQDQAVQLLENFASKYPTNCERVHLTLAQMQMDKGNVEGAITLLQKISSLQKQPALVATLVTLYEQVGDISNASKLLDQFAASLEKGEEEEYILQLRFNAAFKLKHKLYKDAANVLEKVVKANPNDLEALPQLVIAYSHFDSKLAEKYEAKLPRLADQEGEEKIDAEALENLAVPKFLAKRDPTGLEEKTKEAKEEKPKKKKKPRLPKNFDPNKPVDPERWIPLRERSYYKRKGKNKNKLEKSSQGAAPTPRNVPVLGKVEETSSQQPSQDSKPSTDKKENQPSQQSKQGGEKKQGTEKKGDQPKGEKKQQPQQQQQQPKQEEKKPSSEEGKKQQEGEKKQQNTQKKQNTQQTKKEENKATEEQQTKQETSPSSSSSKPPADQQEKPKTEQQEKPKPNPQQPSQSKKKGKK